MPFLPGNPGKPKGAIGKRSREFLEVLEKNKFCAASAMIEIYKISMERFRIDIEKEDVNRYSPMESNAAKYLKTAADMASDLASYAYPKLKAIDRTTNPIQGMTAEQKLRAAEAAVEMYKLQLSQSNGNS